MSQRQAVTKILKLATKSNCQKFIAREKEIMGCLLNFLGSSNDETSLVALNAVFLLTTHKDNIEVLGKNKPLVEKLREKLTTSMDTNAKKFARRSLSNLGILRRSESKSKAPRPSVSSICVRVEVSAMYSDNEKAKVESALVKQAGKGIVSVSIRDDVVTVYAQGTEADVMKLITRTVAPLGVGQVTPINASENKDPQTKQATMGGSSKKYPKKSKKSYPRGRGALTKHGNDKEKSLEERYMEKRKKQQDKDGAGKVKSLIGSVTSFFW